MKKSIMIVALLLSGSSLFAQQVTLSGTVIEWGTNNPLANATLTLLPQGAAITDRSGKFKFTRLKAGTYQLITSYVSYKSDTLHLNLSKDTALRIVLKSVNSELAEVVIKSDVPPASVRRDTIVFNTRAYKTRRNAPVEDILRQLPGIQIDRDGNITMNGQKVDRILIDGKTFFIDDLRKSTRNLPADIISQVQVFDTQTDEDKEAGTTKLNSNTKTLNIKLKKNAKQGIVGKVYAGTGTDEAYAAGGTLTAISGKPLFSIETRANNINDQFTGTESRFALLNANKRNLADLNLNYKNNIGKNLDATVFLDVDQNRSHQQSTLLRKTFLPDSALSQYSINQQQTSAFNGQAGVRFDYKPTERDNLHYGFKFGLGSTSNLALDSSSVKTQKSGSTYLASLAGSRNQEDDHNHEFEQQLSWIHRFSRAHRSLMIQLMENNKSSSNDQFLQTVLQDFAANNSKNTDQKSADPLNGNSYLAALAYNEPLDAHHNIRVTYEYSSQVNRSNKTSRDFNPLTGQYDLIDTLTTNRFASRNNTQQVNLSFNNGVEGKLNYDLTLNARKADADNSNYTHQQFLDKTWYNFAPSFGLNYHIKEGESLRFSYDGENTNPGLEQLQPLPDLSNPLLIRLGNPDLRPQFEHSVTLFFSHFNSASSRNLQLVLNANLVQHQISPYSILLNGGVQQQQYVNLDGIYHLNAFGVYDLQLGTHGNANVSAGLSYNQDKAVVNGRLNTNDAPGAHSNLGMNYHLSDKFFLETAAGFGWQSNHYDLAGQTDSYTISQGYSMDMSLSLPWALTTGGHYELQVRNTSGLPAQQSNLLNAWLSKDLNASHALQARLSAFNLLNAAAAVSQTNGPNFTELRSSNSIGRLILFSFIYNFKSLGAEKGS